MQSVSDDEARSVGGTGAVSALIHFLRARGHYASFEEPIPTPNLLEPFLAPLIDNRKSSSPGSKLIGGVTIYSGWEKIMNNYHELLVKQHKILKRPGEPPSTTFAASALKPWMDQKAGTDVMKVIVSIMDGVMPGLIPSNQVVAWDERWASELSAIFSVVGEFYEALNSTYNPQFMKAVSLSRVSSSCSVSSFNNDDDNHSASAATSSLCDRNLLHSFSNALALRNKIDDQLSVAMKFIKENKFIEARNCFNILIREAEKESNSQVRSAYLSAIYLGRGQANMGLENFDIAINDFNESLKIINDESLKKLAISLLCNSYIKNGEKKFLSNDFSGAILNYEKCFEITEEYKLKKFILSFLSIAYMKRGEEHFISKEFSAAILDFHESIEIVEDRRLKSVVRSTLSASYMAMAEENLMKYFTNEKDELKRYLGNIMCSFKEVLERNSQFGEQIIKDFDDLNRCSQDNILSISLKIIIKYESIMPLPTSLHIPENILKDICAAIKFNKEIVAKIPDWILVHLKGVTPTPKPDTINRKLGNNSKYCCLIQ